MCLTRRVTWRGTSYGATIPQPTQGPKPSDLPESAETLS